ncbi:hypothetical protein AOQ84DRAFT_373919 [Glonium stellatum]|uniref:Uncharacterized protein n=1 Tax=Glonium stellatum TaxID=574774 RepID=A0A8E2F6N4_9PEZI|nr:hypothetical protein AOQ84DRAFT_373919 [Glonium stellatum]
MAPNRLLQTAAIAHVLISLAHTAKGIPMFQEPAFRRLPPILLGAARAGWYQGSVFFAMMGLVNWKWATDGFNDSIDLAIASLISVIYFGSSGWYVKTGDRPTAGVLSLVALFQIASLRSTM